MFIELSAASARPQPQDGFWHRLRQLIGPKPQIIAVKLLPGTLALLEAAAIGSEYLLLDAAEWAQLEAWHDPFTDGLNDRAFGNAEACAAASTCDCTAFSGLKLTDIERAALAAMAASDTSAVRHCLHILSLGSDNASVAQAGGVNNPAGGSAEGVAHV